MSRAVYTALIGGYEHLLEQPIASASGIPFICFTDDPDLRSDSWDVRLVEPALPMDPTRSARALKIVGHPDLDGFEETLWVDARVELRTDPNQILDLWLTDADLSAPRHSFRPDVVSEFHAVLVAGLDDASRIYEQLTHYNVIDPALLEAPTPWTALLARRHTEPVDDAMRRWWLHVLRYSRRDQLSVSHAVSSAGVRLNLVELDNFESELHRWHGARGRSPRPALLQVSESLQPPVARIAELEQELAQLAVQTARAVAAREDELQDTLAEVRRLTRMLRRKQARIEDLRSKVSRSSLPRAADGDTDLD